MKIVQKLTIPLSSFLIGWSIKSIVTDIVQNEKNLSAIISLSLPKEALILMAIALLLFLIVFVFPYLISIIIKIIKHYKVLRLQKRASKFVKKAYKETFGNNNN